MPYKRNCRMFDEVSMGNPGKVPYCSEKGTFEPDCTKCNRPEKDNGDLIRSLSDEKLADYLYNHDFCKEPIKSIENGPCDWDCRKCISEWIKSPVEENPDPVYHVICPLYMSVIKYKKSEVQNDHVSCPCCSFSIRGNWGNKTEE